MLCRVNITPVVPLAYSETLLFPGLLLQMLLQLLERGSARGVYGNVL